MHRRAFILAGLLALSLALLACERAPSNAPATQGSAGAPARQLDESSPLSPRLVVLSPALGQVLADLALAPLIIGRHGFDAFLPDSIPVAGDQGGIDYERLLTLQPTHILLEWGQRELPTRLTAMAAEHRWEILNITMLTLDDLERVTLDLRDRFPATLATPPPTGTGPTAEQLRERFDRAWGPGARSSSGDLGKAGRVLLLGSLDPPSAFGPRSWHHQLLERLGGTPAISEGTPWITFDTEDVLKLAPDAIVLITPRAPGTTMTVAPNAIPNAPTTAIATSPPTFEELRARLGRIATLDIPAIRHRRLALIDDPRAHLAGPGMLELAEQLKGVMAAWIKPEPEPEAARPNSPR
jgi:ABC-type Fe3+-hydroxamate transport system substrate-binding protein